MARQPTPAHKPAAPAAAVQAPAPETAAIAAPERAVPEGMVEVRQLSIDAGPDGVAHPGDIRLIPADDPMIDAGFVQKTTG